MNKFISVLLSAVMLVSAIGSSFTVSAADYEDAAVQSVQAESEQQGGLSGLFDEELSEKVAEQLNDYAITSVEMTGNRASVTYHAATDCTVVVGIFEDDGTNGEHLLTYGKVEVSADDTEASVTIRSLPEYYYLKAFLVDTKTYRPLTNVYDSPNYTKSMVEFFNLIIDDFDPDRVWNFDDDPGNNFMVLSEKAKVINTDHEIGSDDILAELDKITVNNADTDSNLLSLEKGDPFMIFSDDYVLHGVVSGVYFSEDKKVAVIKYESALMSDLFKYIRIETDPEEMSRSEERAESDSGYTIETVEGPSYLSSGDSKSDFSVDTGKRKYGVTFEIEIDEETNKPKFKTSDWSKLSSDSSTKKVIKGKKGAYISAYIQVSSKVYYYIDDSKAQKSYSEVTVTPKLEFTVKGEFTIEPPSLKDLNIIPEIKIPIVQAYAVPIATLRINLVFKGMTLTAKANGSLSISSTSKISYDHITDNKSEIKDTPTFEATIEGTLSIKLPLELSVSFNFFDSGIKDKDKEPVCLVGFVLKFTLTPDVTLTVLDTGIDSTNGLDYSEKKHLCNPFTCFNGTLSVELGIYFEIKIPLLKKIGAKPEIKWTIKEIELLPEDMRNFNISESHGWIPRFGECENFAYRTKIRVVDKLTGEPISNIYVNTSDLSLKDPQYCEGRTNSSGQVTFYLKKNNDINISCVDITWKKYSDASKTARISDVDETITIEMNQYKPPASITPLPEEADAVPKYKVGEGLRYTQLKVVYEEVGTGEGKEIFEIPFSSEYIKQFDPYTVGEQELIIDYNGCEWKKTIEIIEEERHIESISVNTLPDKTRYQLNEPFDITGLTLNTVFTDGTTNSAPVIVTEDMVSGFDSSVTGEKPLVVTYTDQYGDTATTAFTVIVVDGRIDRIEMASMPQVTEYRVGDEDFFVAGAEINVIYNDGTPTATVTVTPSMVSGFNSTCPGDKKITVTYSEDGEKTHTTDFTVTVIDKEIVSIEILQLYDKNRYCLINDKLNYEDAMIKVCYVDGEEKAVQITEEMTGEFDSSRLGTFPVIVTYGDCQTHYYVDVIENLKKVCRLEFDTTSSDLILHAEDSKKYYDYYIYEHYLDGTRKRLSIYGSRCERDEENNILYKDKLGGTIKIYDFDRHKEGVYEITAEYYSPDGTLDKSVFTDSMWISVTHGKSGFDFEPQVGDKQNFAIWGNPYGAGVKNDFLIGDSIDLSSYSFDFDMYQKDPDTQEYKWISIDQFVRDADGNRIRIPGTRHYLVSPAYILSAGTYLGGFYTEYPTVYSFASRHAYFEYDGYVFTLHYSVNGYSVGTIKAPDSEEEPQEEIVEISYMSSSFCDTETVAYNSNNSVSEAYSSTDRRTATYSNLLKNEIYNYYVVINEEAGDFFDEDNLLFIGQGVTDGNGKLSFRYETTTGEDGIIVLRPMSDDSHTHSYSTLWKSDGTSHWHECSCGDKADVSEHISDNGTVKVQPSATTAGLREYSCSICGYVLRTETIPATGGNGYRPNITPPTDSANHASQSVFNDKLSVKTEVKGSTVTLKWDEIKNADKYIIYQYKNKKYVKIKTTDDTSVKIKKLKNGQTYKFLVKYMIGEKLSPEIYSGKVTVKPYYKPLPKATATDNSVRLTWKAVPKAKKYAVYKYVNGKAVKLIETKKLSVKITKLSPDKEYKYIVRAYVDGKWTTMMKSDIVTIRTEK